MSERDPVIIRLRNQAGEEHEVQAKVLVDASGQQAFLANRLGLRVMNPELRKVALWGHFQNAERTGPESAELTTILHVAEKRAWFWYIPLSDNKVSVGLVGDSEYLLKGEGRPQQVFDQHVSSSPVMRQRLSGASCVEGLHVAKEFSYTTTQHAGDRWVLVGDAFGFIDPVYSTGVLLALRSGELAADCISDALTNDDLSAASLGRWIPDFEEGVERFRRLVQAFYTNQFSFAKFLKKHPRYQGSLIDLLIGRAFKDDVKDLVIDLDIAIQDAVSGQPAVES
jgi:flavin-dependent dehydrogenase